MKKIYSFLTVFSSAFALFSHIPLIYSHTSLLYYSQYVLSSNLFPVNPTSPSITATHRDRERMMLGWMQEGRWGGIIRQETEEMPVQPSSPPSIYLSFTHTHTHRQTHTPRLCYFPMWGGIMLSLLSVLLLYKPTNPHHVSIPHHPLVESITSCCSMWLHVTALHVCALGHRAQYIILFLTRLHFLWCSILHEICLKRQLN